MNLTPPTREVITAGRSLVPEMARASETTTVPAQPTPHQDAVADEFTRRLDLGRQLFRAGKVIQAREQYLAAVGGTPAIIMLELARTFDPHYLGQVAAADVAAEPRRAASLYETAVRRGSEEAIQDLARLRAAYPGVR